MFHDIALISVLVGTTVGFEVCSAITHSTTFRGVIFVVGSCAIAWIVWQYFTVTFKATVPRQIRDFFSVREAFGFGVLTGGGLNCIGDSAAMIKSRYDRGSTP